MPSSADKGRHPRDTDPKEGIYSKDRFDRGCQKRHARNESKGYGQPDVATQA